MASEKLYPHLMPMPFLVTTSYGVQIHTLFRTATWEWGQGCWGAGEMVQLNLNLLAPQTLSQGLSRPANPSEQGSISLSRKPTVPLESL